MAKALLITRDDIVKKTALNGNVDVDLFIQFVNIAQDTHIQSFLGTRLLEKIQDLIIENEVDLSGNAAYRLLLVEYIKPMLIHYAMVEYLPFGAYTIANKGIYKHGSENSESVSKTEIDYLIMKQKQIAEHYTKRFIDFISFQTSVYPEYNANSNGDMFPDTNTNFTGWVI